MKAPPGKTLKERVEVVSHSRDEFVYRLPRGIHGGWLFLIFGGCWFTQSLLIGIVAFLVQGRPSRPDTWVPGDEYVMWALTMIFPLIGLGLLLMGFVLLFGRQTLVLTPEVIRLTGRFGQQVSPRGYAEVHGLELKAGHKALRFGSNIPEEDLKKLRRDIAFFANYHVDFRGNCFL